MKPLADLPHEWRTLASRQRELGAEAQACTLEWCAEKLTGRLREWELEKLTLEEAARESGYSRSSFERWLASGEISNAGEEGSPRVRRRDLPRKPGGATSAPETDDGLPDVVEEILTGAPV